MDMLWLTAANILASFHIDKPIDEHGVIIQPNGEFTSGMIRCVLSLLSRKFVSKTYCSFPKPFRASFKPRTAASIDLIQSSVVMD